MGLSPNSSVVSNQPKPLIIRGVNRSWAQIKLAKVLQQLVETTLVAGEAASGMRLVSDQAFDQVRCIGNRLKYFTKPVGAFQATQWLKMFFSRALFTSQPTKDGKQPVGSFGSCLTWKNVERTAKAVATLVGFGLFVAILKQGKLGKHGKRIKSINSYLTLVVAASAFTRLMSRKQADVKLTASAFKLGTELSSIVPGTAQVTPFLKMGSALTGCYQLGQGKETLKAPKTTTSDDIPTELDKLPVDRQTPEP